MINPEVRQFGNILKQTRIEQDGSIKRTVIEYFPVHVTRVAKRAVKKIGGDAAQLVKEIPWKNRMLHTVIASWLWYNCGGAELLNDFKNDLQARIQTFEAAINNITAHLPTKSESSSEETLVFAPTVIPTEVSIEIRPEEIKSETQEPSYGVYKVQRGDTLFSLARRFGTSVEVIMEDNLWIGDRNTIHVGNDLKIRAGVSLETPVKDEFRRITGNPETYRITDEDISYLQWLNAKEIWWEDWGGGRQIIFITVDAFRYAMTVEKAGGPPCSLVLGLGATETGYYYGPLWETHTKSYAGAVGPMQILLENFKYFAPYPDGNPIDPKYNFLTGGNLAYYLGLDTSLTEGEFVNIFLGEGPTGRVWNYHEKQAVEAHRIAKELEGQRAQFEIEYQQKID